MKNIDKTSSSFEDLRPHEEEEKKEEADDNNGDGGGGAIIKANNYVDGKFTEPSGGEYMDVINPSNGRVVGKVALSSYDGDGDDVSRAVSCAKRAFASWSNRTIKSRAAVMLKFHNLVHEHAAELAELIVLENGKNMTEALADVAKGNETVEYACSLPQLAKGDLLRVSTDVTCQDSRQPLGVVSCVVPFNFPFMVPMWTVPIALVMGNTVVLKPSEKVPLTMYKVVEYMERAGFPPGVFNMVNGTKGVVGKLIRHPDVTALTFVGSSPVAEIVSSRCRAHHKRCTALGGAKNHLVALDDCDVDTASSDICVSFAGCAGQRCMAASVLLLIGDAQARLLDSIVERASKIRPGNDPGQMGPVIDRASYDKIRAYIAHSVEKCGAKLLLDGRSWKERNGSVGGNWIGPTVLLHDDRHDKTMSEEVFGPVLSVYVCKSWEEAVQIENENPFGNAASVYTCNQANANWFLSRFRASMLGVNIGIPVPREPFSFGGLYGTKSKYGDMDITGDGAVEFFSDRIKITSKWPLKRKAEHMMTTTETAATNGGGANATNNNRNKVAKNGGDDHANFAGSM